MSYEGFPSSRKEEEFPQDKQDMERLEKKEGPENFEQATDMLVQEGDALMAQNHNPDGRDPKSIIH